MNPAQAHFRYTPAVRRRPRGLAEKRYRTPRMFQVPEFAAARKQFFDGRAAGCTGRQRPRSPRPAGGSSGCRGHRRSDRDWPHGGAVLPAAKSSAVVTENSRCLQRAPTGLMLPGASTRIARSIATRRTGRPRACPGCSERSRCKAARDARREAYLCVRRSAARARGHPPQVGHRRWAFFSSLVDRLSRPPRAPRPLPRLEMAYQENQPVSFDEVPGTL